MQTPVQDSISGREYVNDNADPLAGLAQFYRALNTRDLLLMQENWDQGDDIVMDNPLGGIKRGWAEIRQVYERLFRTDESYYFEFYDYTIQRFEDVFLAVGRERGKLGSLDLAIRTSRIFRWTNGRWRQIHHHGSIEEPRMLSSYLESVLKRSA